MPLRHASSPLQLLQQWHMHTPLPARRVHALCVPPLRVTQRQRGPAGEGARAHARATEPHAQCAAGARGERGLGRRRGSRGRAPPLCRAPHGWCPCAARACAQPRTARPRFRPRARALVLAGALVRACPCTHTRAHTRAGPPARACLTPACAWRAVARSGAPRARHARARFELRPHSRSPLAGSASPAPARVGAAFTQDSIHFFAPAGGGARAAPPSPSPVIFIAGWLEGELAEPPVQPAMRERTGVSSPPAAAGPARKRPFSHSVGVTVPLFFRGRFRTAVCFR